MPDLKISEMTPPASVLNGYLLPVTDAVNNYAATRAQMLIGGPSEDLTIQVDLGQTVEMKNGTPLDYVRINPDRTVEIGSQLRVFITNNTTESSFEQRQDGTFLIFPGGTGRFEAASFSGAASLVVCDDVGQSEFFVPGGVLVSLRTMGAGIFLDPQPDNVADAIERIAIQVALLIGGPIP